MFSLRKSFVADFVHADEATTRPRTIAFSSGPIGATQAAFGGFDVRLS
ncbi:hypothetical protein [Actinospica robiniae]|nr:hypothetical protein [Actinospica robiniae]